MKWQLTYKGKGYGRKYDTLDELLAAMKEMNKHLQNLGWRIVRNEPVDSVRVV